MKTLIIALLLVCFGIASAQQAPPDAPGEVNPPPQTAPTGQAETAPNLAPVAGLLQPERYAVAFLPLDKGNVGVAFLVAPDGRLGTLPIRDLTAALKGGNRPFTVADLLAIANSVADEEKNSQRKIKELSEDYDALAARYNRLAAINSANSVQPQPAYDERQAMRAMVFRSLLQRTLPAPPMQIQVQTVDCGKFPALCVNH
jgi:hypothetical protein